MSHISVFLWMLGNFSLGFRHSMFYLVCVLDVLYAWKYYWDLFYNVVKLLGNSLRFCWQVLYVLLDETRSTSNLGYIYLTAHYSTWYSVNFEVFCWRCMGIFQPSVSPPYCFPQYRVSQPWCCWCFRPDNSLLWGALPGTVACSAASLAPIYLMVVAPSLQVVTTKISGDIAKWILRGKIAPSRKWLLWCFGAALSLVSGSFLAFLHWSVCSWMLEGEPLEMSQVLPLSTSILCAPLPCDF